MEGIDKNKMEKTIAINAGSSSLKFQLYDMPSERVITAGIVERIGLKDSIFTITVDGEKIKEIIDIPDHEIAVQMLLEKLINHKVIGSYDEITGIGHRVVHGGERFPESVYIDDQVIKDIEALSELAPLHNPANVTGIKAFRKILPDVVSVAVFDTAFHQTMPPASYLYSLPYSYYEDYGIRKYGFHGTSHKYVSERADETYYCFVKGYFKDKNPFTDQMSSYREEVKRVFLRRIEAETSIGNADYQFETLKNKALENEGIAHYLESFSASLGKYIFSKRMEKKWSQLDLALKSDLSPVIIGRLEAGDPDLTLRMYQKVCTVLGVKATFSVD